MIPLARAYLRKFSSALWPIRLGNNSPVDCLISSTNTDADLTRPIEVVTDMSKSRAMGSTAYQASDQPFFLCWGKLRKMRLIPQVVPEHICSDDFREKENGK